MFSNFYYEIKIISLNEENNKDYYLLKSIFLLIILNFKNLFHIDK